MSVTINKNITDKIAKKTAEDKMMEKFLLEILQIEAEHKQFKKNYLLKLRTPETLMRQGFIGFSDIRRHHIMHTVSGTFPINRAVLP